MVEGFWYRRIEEVVHARTGALLNDVRYDGFNASPSQGMGFTPTIVRDCGNNGMATCRNHTFTFVKGDVAAHALPNTSTELFVRDSCGLVIQHTDVVGRVRATPHTNCRLASVEYQGGTLAITRDDLAREQTVTLTPGSTSAPMSWTNFYDDVARTNEDITTTRKKLARRRSDGQTTIDYVDGFGRLTKRVECSTPAPAPGAALSLITCTAGTERTLEWNLYGSDGLLKVHAGPHAAGVTPATTGFAHDGAGRVIVQLSPGHTTTPSWSATTWERGADWLSTQDPVGTTRSASWTTLSTEAEEAGVVVGSTDYDALGRPVREEDALGAAVTTTYEQFGNPSIVSREGTVECGAPGGLSEPCAWTLVYTGYDTNDRVLGLTGPDGAWSFTYDAAGRVKTKTVGGTLVESTQYLDQLSSPEVEVTLEGGAVHNTRFDGVGRVVHTEVLDWVEEMTWGANGRPATISDASDRVTTLTYDVHDQLVSRALPGGAVESFAYDGAGRLASATDPDGVETTSAFWYSGMPKNVSLELAGSQWSGAYDAVGRLVDVTAGGVRSTATYDARGRVTQAAHALDALGVPDRTEAYTYDLAGRWLTHAVTPRIGAGFTETATWDAWGRPATQSDGVGTWTLRHDAAGRTRYVQDADGRVWESEYDDRGRLVAQDFPGGRQTLAYAAGVAYAGHTQLHRVQSFTSATGPATSTYTDAAGRQIATVSPTGESREEVWTGGDHTGTIRLDVLGSDIGYIDRTYDTAGRLSTLVGPYAPGETAKDTSTYTYTAAGRLLTQTAAEQTTTFTYDLAGRLSTETWDHLQRSLTYGPATAPWVTQEALLDLTTSQARTRSTLYDVAGRPTSETVTAPGLSTIETRWLSYGAWGPQQVQRWVAGAVESTTSWAFDAGGRPASRTVDLGTTGLMTTQWTWTPGGDPATVTAPSGKQLAYGYGTNGLLSRVYDPTGAITTDHVSVTAWNDRGQPTGADVGDDTQWSLAYDDAGRMVERTVFGPSVSTSWTGSYNGIGKLASETIDAGTEWTNTYEYNGRGRLTEEVRGQTGETVGYTWSTGGNLLAKTTTPTSGSPTTVAYTYSGQRLTAVGSTALSYTPWDDALTDSTGNDFTFTADGEVRTVEGPSGPVVTLLRDGDGLPVAHQEGGAATRLVTWGLTGASPLEVRPSSGTTTKTYVDGPVGLVGSLDLAGAFVGAELDAAGTLLREGTSAAGGGTAFGLGTAAPPGSADRFVFAGLESVAGAPNVHLARHRVYDSATGRFTSPDPIGLAGGEHRFLYADGDPVTYSDVMGWSYGPQPVTTNGVPCMTVGSGSGAFPGIQYDFNQHRTSWNEAVPWSGTLLARYEADKAAKAFGEAVGWAHSMGRAIDQGPSRCPPTVPHCGAGDAPAGPPGVRTKKSGDGDTWEVDLNDDDIVDELYCASEGCVIAEGKRRRGSTPTSVIAYGRERGQGGGGASGGGGGGSGHDCEAYGECGETGWEDHKMVGYSSEYELYMLNNDDAQGAFDKAFYNVVDSTYNTVTDPNTYSGIAVSGLMRLAVGLGVATPNIRQQVIMQDAENGRAMIQGTVRSVSLLADELVNGGDKWQTLQTGTEAEAAELGQTQFETGVASFTFSSTVLSAGLALEEFGAAGYLKRVLEPGCFTRRHPVSTPAGMVPIEAVGVAALVVASSVDAAASTDGSEEPAVELEDARPARRGAWAPRALCALLAACGPELGEPVQTYDARTGYWDEAPVALEVSDEYLVDGHLFRVTADGVEDRGEATVEELAASDETWVAEAAHRVPDGDEWGLVLGDADDAGHWRLAEVEPGEQFAFQGRVFDTADADGDGRLEVRATGDVIGRVVNTFVRHAPEVIDAEITYADGTTDVLTGTPNHPFWVDAVRDYVPLGDLAVGTQLHVQGGGTAILVSKTWRQGDFEVFNLEVEGVHNYYVHAPGSDSAGVLVHNGPCPFTLTPATGREMLREAVGNLRTMRSGGSSAAEMADAFEGMAEQITRADPGWDAVRMTGADGSHIFAGEFGESLVVTPQGGIFRGSMQNAAHFIFGADGSVTPVLEAMTEIK